VTVVCVYLSTKEKRWYQVITGCSVILCQRQNSVELMTTCGLELASLNDSWTIQCLRLGLKVKYLVMLATNVNLIICHVIFLFKDDSWSTCPLRKDIPCIFKFYVKNECFFLLHKYAHLFVLLLWNNFWEFWFPTNSPYASLATRQIRHNPWYGTVLHCCVASCSELLNGWQIERCGYNS